MRKRAAAGAAISVHIKRINAFTGALFLKEELATATGVIADVCARRKAS
jgi:hypothetical protein